MPVRGIKEAKQRTRKLILDLAGPVTERAITAALITGQGYATLMTPADTGTLRNSQYRRVDGAHGRVGYTTAYAAAVHDAKGTLRGQPRANGNGNYWDPAGQPEFLVRAFEENEAEIRQVIVRESRI
jgi:hypothetical protein